MAGDLYIILWRWAHIQCFRWDSLPSSRLAPLFRIKRFKASVYSHRTTSIISQDITFQSEEVACMGEMTIWPGTADHITHVITTLFFTFRLTFNVSTSLKRIWKKVQESVK